MITGSYESIMTCDAIISATASQITGITIVYSAVCSGADQRKHQKFASLDSVRGILRCPLSTGLDTYFFLNLAVGQPSNNMDLSEIEIYLGIMIKFFLFR